MPRSFLWLGCLSLIAACRSTPPATVPVTGDAASLGRMAGVWEGSYQSPAVGRAGSIVFTLTSGEDHAHGDVVMVPRGTNQPLRPAGGRTPGIDSSASVQVLSINFIRAMGDSVMGTLAAYTDPDCNCSTSAEFRGHLEGDRIRGTFVATQVAGRSLTGTWEVRRRS